jgi:thioredoxin reductase (NADPH)
VASGASARWLGLPSEQALIGHGVSSCATCDGFFFRGKEIAVVGGGDSAMEEALFLTRFASKVTLLHRREGFRASKIMLERAIAHPNIELRPNTVVEEVLGVEEKEVKGLRLKDVKTGEDANWPSAGCFWASATSRTQRCLPGRWIWTRRATSRPRATC